MLGEVLNGIFGPIFEMTQENIAIDQIRDFCDRYSQNHFVISCRVAVCKGDFNRVVDVTMTKFDDEQIEQFMNCWFSSTLDAENATAERFWRILKQSENDSARELAQMPLLLTFLCLVYSTSLKNFCKHPFLDQRVY